MKVDYTTKDITNNLLEEIRDALKNIQWGSLEIYVQDSTIVQITERNIKKLSASTPRMPKKTAQSQKIILKKK